MKKCRSCLILKDEKEFHKNKALCKVCTRSYDQTRYCRVIYNVKDLEGELWKDVAGFEGHYQISNMGRCKSLQRLIGGNAHSTRLHSEKIIKPRPATNGYLRFQLGGNTKFKDHSAHRLVALNFIQIDKERPFVNHKDGDKQNNNVENLEWCTKSENMKHAYDVLNMRSKLNNPKGTDSKICKGEIIAFDEEGRIIHSVPYFARLKEFGFRPQDVSSVLKGRKERYRGLYWKRSTQVAV